MATTTLRLIPTSDGSHQLVIEHESDPDALSHEHEEEHKDIANSVIEGGLKSGKVKVSRERDGRAREPAKPHEIQERESIGNNS